MLDGVGLNAQAIEAKINNATTPLPLIAVRCFISGLICPAFMLEETEDHKIIEEYADT